MLTVYLLVLYITTLSVAHAVNTAPKDRKFNELERTQKKAVVS
jgi:hypothetical protein